MVLQSGTTAVLAGLINRDESAVKESVPFIGDVPFMEYLFGAQGEEKTDNYDFFFITAYILPSVEDEQRRIAEMMDQREQKAGTKFEQEQKEGRSESNSLEKQLRNRQNTLEQEFEGIKRSGEK